VLGWAAACFLGLQLASSFLLDYAWPQLRFPYFYRRVEQAAALPVPPAVVCLGSSRTGSTVSAEEMTRILRDLTGDDTAAAFNASAPAADLVVCERMLGELLRRGVRPRVVVQELCPEMLNHRNLWLRMHVARSLYWHDVPAFAGELLRTGNAVRLLGSRLLPLYASRDMIQRSCRDAFEDWWARRAGPGAPAPGEREPARTAADWHRLIAAALAGAPQGPNERTLANVSDVSRELGDYRPGGNSAAALEQMARLCRDRGIRLVLVGIPLASAHRGCYTPAVEAAFREHLRRLEASYGCPFVDYRDAVPDAYFLDHHHSGPEGCLLFTARLSAEVVAPACRAGGR
jgi:hypothetical protein